RTAGPARMGRHRASDRRTAGPRAGTGPHRDIARISGGPPAIRAGGARAGCATSLLRWPAVGSAALASEPAAMFHGSDDARARVAALSRGDSSRTLRGGNRTGQRSFRGTFAPSATARRRVPRLQRASGEPAPRSRCGADDGVWLAGVGPAGAASRVPVALVTMEPRARDLAHRRENPPAPESGGQNTAHRDAFRVYGPGDGGYRAPRPRGYRDWRSPLVPRRRHRTR